MRHAAESLLEWLSSPENPPVRYLTARDLTEPRPSADELERLRNEIMEWQPLQAVLSRQIEDGSFPCGQKTPTAQPTFAALVLMQRCGLSATDPPARRAITYLTERQLSKGGISYTGGGSGVLPCYMGVVATALFKMGAGDTEVAQSAITWLVDHQRFDHKEMRAGGDKEWSYKAPRNYGCWDSVSCYHGVAAAFRAFAAIPADARSDDVHQRLDDALEYLRIHRLYRRTSTDQPLFRHMTQFFLIGDYRSHLIDMLEGVADADPELIRTPWIEAAVADVQDHADQGRIPLVKNYGRKLIYPLPVEPIGEPSRFLTYQWLNVLKGFESKMAA